MRLHASEEADRRRLVGVVLGELQEELESAPFPRSVVRSEDNRLPESEQENERFTGDSFRLFFFVLRRTGITKA